MTKLYSKEGICDDETTKQHQEPADIDNGKSEMEDKYIKLLTFTYLFFCNQGTSFPCYIKINNFFYFMSILQLPFNLDLFFCNIQSRTK